MIQAMFHSALVTNVQVIGPLSNKYMGKKNNPATSDEIGHI